MAVEVRPVADPTPWAGAVRRLLWRTDDEFVPPLSTRSGTTQTDGLAAASERSHRRSTDPPNPDPVSRDATSGGFDAYCASVLAQPAVLALGDAPGDEREAGNGNGDGDRDGDETGTVVGLLSVRDGYRASTLGDYQPAAYVTTVVVDPAVRRRGIARRLYTTLAEDPPADVASPFLATRTWSTNRGHVTLLTDLGFEAVTRLPDDRSAGVDTVYYAAAVDTVATASTGDGPATPG
jgi:ribosomal protein S18 acetylase RimI-like enzyme